MTPEQRQQLLAICREHAGLTVAALWRLVLQAEVFSQSEIDELCREAEGRVIARVLQADPALRRRVEEEGAAALEELRRAIEADLDACGEGS